LLGKIQPKLEGSVTSQGLCQADEVAIDDIG
jgi:hypothetical protein